jgi:hypothetical protein
MIQPVPARLLLAAMLLAAPMAQAQSSCSSDGQLAPVALRERFVNADCASCWSDPATVAASQGEAVLDWIVPGSLGDDAPLSAAARREARERLQALGRALPAQSDGLVQRVTRPAMRLRVAHGQPFNDYVAGSIELQTPPRGGPWTAWLALVETIPAGTEGTPVTRHLVRNTLQVEWQAVTQASANQKRRLLESRPMQLAEGARASRLGVVGWVQDARGRIRALSVSAC